MRTILDRICADKLGHIVEKKKQRPLWQIQSILQDLPPTRGFIDALSIPETALIAEVKKASPSKGIIRVDFDPLAIAKIYEANGAACLSVLTDELYFMGRDEYLEEIHANVSLPILRKDFMLDEYQLYESRALGADCILLIMAALNDNHAAELYDCATSLGLDTLFEVHDEEELSRALDLNPKMVGVNNRNLKTMEVSLETGLALGDAMPSGIVKVAESGISTPAEIARFKTAGFNAFLIGESLMKEPDIAAATRKILGN